MSDLRERLLWEALESSGHNKRARKIMAEAADEIASLQARVSEMQYEAGMYQNLYELAQGRLASARKALEVAEEANSALHGRTGYLEYERLESLATELRQAFLAQTDEKGES